MNKSSCLYFKTHVMRKYIKLLIIPISLLLTNCTSGQDSAATAGTDSMQVDSSATAGQGPDTMKADTPITNGQRSNPDVGN
jgi:hypothetical protein